MPSCVLWKAVKFQVIWQFLNCRMIFLSHSLDTERVIRRESSTWEKMLMHTSPPIFSNKTIYQEFLKKISSILVLTTPAAFLSKESSIFFTIIPVCALTQSFCARERGTAAHYLQLCFCCLITVFPEKWALHQMSTLQHATTVQLWQSQQQKKGLKQLIPSIHVKLLYSDRSL